MGILRGESATETTKTNLQSASPGLGGFNAILDRGSEFEGKLTFEGTVRIDGKFKGEIVSEANLVVGESGKLEANIQVGTVTISGEVRGNITGKNKVELHSTAEIHGNIETPKLIIEEGAVFEGNCSMAQFSSEKKNKTRNEPSRFDFADKNKEHLA